MPQCHMLKENYFQHYLLPLVQWLFANVQDFFLSSLGSSSLGEIFSSSLPNLYSLCQLFEMPSLQLLFYFFGILNKSLSCLDTAKFHTKEVCRPYEGHTRCWSLWECEEALSSWITVSGLVFVRFFANGVIRGNTMLLKSEKV